MGVRAFKNTAPHLKKKTPRFLLLPRFCARPLRLWNWRKSWKLQCLFPGTERTGRREQGKRIQSGLWTGHGTVRTVRGSLGEEKADMKNYIQILDAGFEEIWSCASCNCGSGDDRWYYPKLSESVKVLFFTGVNEGIVPQRKAGGSLLNDGDREVFKSLHMELAPTAREEAVSRNFTFILCFPSPQINWWSLMQLWTVREKAAIRPVL